MRPSRKGVSVPFGAKSASPLVAPVASYTSGILHWVWALPNPGNWYVYQLGKADPLTGYYAKIPGSVRLDAVDPGNGQMVVRGRTGSEWVSAESNAVDTDI